MLWTAFPDELPRSALSLVLDAWRGNSIDRDAAALAAFNVAGFAYTKIGSFPMMSADSADLDPLAVETAFSAILQGSPVMSAADESGADAIPWALIAQVATMLIKRWLAR